MRHVPTARHKLNSAHLVGALVIASIMGAVTGSWLAFLLAAGVLIALAINSGEIRFKGRQ